METKNKNNQTKDLQTIATETRNKYLRDSQDLRNSISIAKKNLGNSEHNVRIEEPIKKPTTLRKTFLDLIDKATKPISGEEAQT